MASPTGNEKSTAVRGLGEIALRVNNLDAMQKFYEEVIGLPLMTRFPNVAFFKIAGGYGGHANQKCPGKRAGQRGGLIVAIRSTFPHTPYIPCRRRPLQNQERTTLRLVESS